MADEVNAASEKRIIEGLAGKVVEVKKPFSVHYSVYYHAPVIGGNEIVAEPGTRFKIEGLSGDDAYNCSAVDREFEKAAEKAELKKVKPFIRAKFGYIEGFKVPFSALEDGTVEIVNVVEIGEPQDESDEDTESDEEDYFDEEEEEDEEEFTEPAYGYPDGYASGTPRGEYCVIDLSPSAEGGGGPLKYPVSFMDKMPEGGWTDEYKTTKIVLKLIKGGEFMMGTEKDEEIRAVNPPHKVKLPNDFYMGVFPVTRRQCEIIFGSCTPASKWPEDDDGKHPVYGVPYTEIRGYVRGCGWPENAGVDYCSFLLALRVSSGIMNLDLPTAAQWEYACKAGAGEMEEDDLKGTAWFNDNSGGRVHPVGMLRPNRWGLYDMLGNVWEWCLDWYGRVTPEVWDESDTFTAPAGVLPLFPSRRMLFPFMSPSGGYAREIRGGGWNTDARNCHASSRASSGPSRGYDFVGFRLSFTLGAERSDTSLMPEKKPAGKFAPFYATFGKWQGV